MPASDIAPTPDIGGDTGGASSSNPPPAPEEMDLTFREEMLTRRGELLAEHELKAEEKEKKLGERIR